MIALVEELPLLKFEDGCVFAFRREWLRQNLLLAAQRAGYRDWWLADHVAQSVVRYLVSEYQESVLAASDLRESVSEVLSKIGYAEIGKQFSPSRPPRDISLLELAQKSGACELAFFSLLKQAIEVEMQEHAVSLLLIHLIPAAKLLLGVKLFTQECGCLREEIVSFARSVTAGQVTTSAVRVLIR